MTTQLLNIERGGHHIVMDRRDGFIRVICNGVVNAQFNETSMTEVKALEHALSFVTYLEEQSLEYQKNPTI